MLEKIPTPYSPAAADAADRLRLIAGDLRLIDLRGCLQSMGD